MAPSLLQIILLALIQGAAELLPISSSAHVIVAEKLMGLDPSSPALTFLLVMLHTGTMAAVIVYFWKAWRKSFFGSALRFKEALIRVVAATIATAVVGEVLKVGIEKVAMHGRPKAEVELLFSNLTLVAASLAVAGFLILVAGLRCRTSEAPSNAPTELPANGPSVWIGLVQGVCLPFRGFSRSGATISTGMLLGIPRRAAEEFSFALSVVLTPPVVLLEFLRYRRAAALAPSGVDVGALLAPGLGGMVCSFVAGLIALKWLSGWLEAGRWHYFGFYCLAAAAGVAALAAVGY